MNRKPTITIPWIAVAILLIGSACAKSAKKSSRGGEGSESQNAGGENTESDNPTTDPLSLTCSANPGRTYKGFGQKELSAGRVEEVPTLGDRARIKPFSALTGEFNRVLQMVPRSLTSNGATFGEQPERWYAEPSVNGVSLFTTYRAAFEGALAYAAGDASLSSFPTEDKATALCTSIAEKAWSRSPQPNEIAACKNIALIETASESDPKIRWAHAIASIMAASSFISY